MTPPYRQRIVAALDLSEFSEVVIEHAIDQATRHDAVDLHVVHVLEHASACLEDVKHSLGAIVVPALESLSSTDWRLRIHVRAGKPAAEITDLAAEVRAHLLVIGRFGVRHPHRRIGLIAGQIVNLAPCPTFVVGLADQLQDAAPQCDACMAVRADSDGRRWFCPQHVSPGRIRLSAIANGGSGWTGGLIW